LIHFYKRRNSLELKIVKMSDVQPELLCRVDFPLYSTAMISPRHLMVAGGGGAANTGVKNGLEIFEITTNGENVVGESITRFFTGEYSVYSLACRLNNNNNNNNLPPKVTVVAGHNQFAQVYTLTLERERKGSGDLGGDVLRHRGSNGVPVGTGVQNGMTETTKLVFKTEPGKKVQIDFNDKEPYGKVIRLSLNGKFMASGGDDGHLRVWSFPDLTKVHDFTTHDKEIDDIDFSPDSAKICSISKDKRAIVWDVKKGKKHAELGWDCPGGVKYLYKRVKFGCVEGDPKKYKIFTISNPIGSSKVPSFLHRWNTQSYTVEGKVASPGLALSALAVSDNGTFVAIGTMSEGIVDIFTSFNLSRVKRVRGAHSTFITGLEFLPTGEESAPCRGFSEASVVSISVDHQVCVHHVAQMSSISSVTAMIFVVFILLATFILCSFLGL